MSRGMEFVSLYQWWAEGTLLNREDAEGLLEELKSAPGVLETRVRLLGFTNSMKSIDPTWSDVFRDQLRWCIENEPHSELHALALFDLEPRSAVSETICAAWQAALARHPGDTTVLRHASLGLLRGGQVELARAVFEQLQLLEPHNPDWLSTLGHFFSRCPEGAEFALVAYERALALQQPREAYTVNEAANLAFKLQRFEQARELALELLEFARTGDLGWMLGNAQYDGHRILGLIALAQGDLAAAERELLESGHTVGSPQLNSFGPELDLANALLQRGRTEVVIEFLWLCERFWKPERLLKFIAAIHAGERPQLNRFSGLADHF
jgi:tetratricopeptide (TPR) repeat protein